MTAFDLQFSGNRIKQLQDNMVNSYSNLVSALQEVKAEQEYIDGIWDGKAAETFAKTQSSIFMRLEECAEKTEELLISLEDAEALFRQCEKTISKMIGEICIWEI